MHRSINQNHQFSLWFRKNGHIFDNISSPWSSFIQQIYSSISTRTFLRLSWTQCPVSRKMNSTHSRSKSKANNLTCNIYAKLLLSSAQDLQSGPLCLHIDTLAQAMVWIMTIIKQHGMKNIGMKKGWKVTVISKCMVWSMFSANCTIGSAYDSV